MIKYVFRTNIHTVHTHRHNIWIWYIISVWCILPEKCTLSDHWYSRLVVTNLFDHFFIPNVSQDLAPWYLPKNPLRRVIFIIFAISVKGSMYKHKYTQTQRKAVMQLYLFNAQYSHWYQFIFTASVQYRIFSLSVQQYLLQSSATAAQCLYIGFALNMAINMTISL